MVPRYIKLQDHESFSVLRHHVILFQTSIGEYGGGWLFDSDKSDWSSTELVIYQRGSKWKWAFLKHSISDHDYILYENPKLYTEIENAMYQGYTAALQMYENEDLWDLEPKNMFNAKGGIHDRPNRS